MADLLALIVAKVASYVVVLLSKLGVINNRFVIANQLDDRFGPAFKEYVELLCHIVVDLDLDNLPLSFVLGGTITFVIRIGNKTDWKETSHLGWVKSLAFVTVGSDRESKFKLHTCGFEYAILDKMDSVRLK